MQRAWLTAPVVLLLACAPAAEPTVEARAGAQDTARTDPLAPYEGGAQRDEVIATVNRLFEALGSGDAELLRSVMDPSVVMHFTETRDGRTSYGSSTVNGLAERITTADAPLIERMWDPVVLVDGRLATLWAPYDFYVGDAFSHCGVDTVNLIQRAEGWTITGLSWTRLQPPDCELHPEGPPE